MRVVIAKAKHPNGRSILSREKIEELNKKAGYEAFFHPDDVEDVHAGGLVFANKEAKERFKKAAKNINPKAEEQARDVQTGLLGLYKLLSKYPKWVFDAPQEVLDSLNRGEWVKCGIGSYLDQNIKKYDEQRREKRRAYYLRKKQKKQQNSK